jgi:23S rRNA (cytidine2498-2'-O)-methyltransferase
MTWIWTTRPGFAADLVEELAGRARAEGPSLVFTESPAKTWPVFARAGFPVAADGPASADALVPVIERLLSEQYPRKPWLLHTWVPDSDATNPLGPAAQSLGDQVLAALDEKRPDLALLRVSSADAARYGGVLVQIALVAPERALVGALPAGDVPSLRPGGRTRAGKPGDAPSRAARKLSEAFEWIGRGPEPGDSCVDLGAAPGGWTAVLLARRARVLAVDPARLAPELMKKKGLVHVQASAFDFEPEDSVDWLLCDMAWRPLEVAELLAKWGRRHWATALVANIKLPMKQRALFVRKVVEVVRGGSWQDVRARQLYHDREEITLAAWRT